MNSSYILAMRKLILHGFIYFLKDWLKSIHSAVLRLENIGLKKKSSSKSSNFFFKANAYCTFSTCNVLAFLDIKDEGLSNTNVTINVKFEGSICHIASERHACRLSLSVRKDTQTYFQQTRIPPSKEYIGRLMKLTPGQFATGNRDNVGCCITKNIIGSKACITRRRKPCIISANT